MLTVKFIDLINVDNAVEVDGTRLNKIQGRMLDNNIYLYFSAIGESIGYELSERIGRNQTNIIVMQDDTIIFDAVNVTFYSYEIEENPQLKGVLEERIRFTRNLQ